MILGLFIAFFLALFIMFLIELVSVTQDVDTWEERRRWWER